MSSAKENKKRATRALIYHEQDGQFSFLLSQRPPWSTLDKDKWALLGGAEDTTDAHSRAALLRELKEETGRDFDPQALEAFGEYVFGDWLTTVFLIRMAEQEEFVDVSGQNNAMKWVPEAEINSEKYPMAFDHGQMIADFLTAQHLTRQ